MRVAERLEKLIPSLPFEFLCRSAVSVENNFTLAHPKVPSINDLDFFNEYWQRQTTSNGTLQIYGAYLDTRDKIENGEQLVRLIVVINQRSVMESVQLNCQLWYKKLNESVIAPVDSERLFWYKEWGYNAPEMWQPYLISCPLSPDKRNTVPVAVSLVERESENVTTNCLSVVNNDKNTESKNKFAVVTKGYDFTTDFSAKLVEWIELLKILGVDHIFFNIMYVPAQTRKTLEYYEEEGIVTVKKFKWPQGLNRTVGDKFGYISNQVQLETIPYNDCLYRNLYNYEYLVVIDNDEVPMPQKEIYDWKQLINVLRDRINDTKREQEIASFAMRNVYYLDEFYTEEFDAEHRAVFNPETPPELYMLRHTARFKEPTPTGHATKCFHTTENVVTLHNHYPFSCLEYCHIYGIDVEDAQLNHYRSRRDSIPIDEGIVEDKTLEKYKELLIERSFNVIRQLGLNKKEENNEMK